jgi:hypothetical protein
MEANSWLYLRAEDARHRLPDDLRARDPFLARDCGWVEQMRPLICALSEPGARVLDPFCGFGSTLLAAALEGRTGIGVELLPERAQITRERMLRLGFEAPEVIAGDALSSLGKFSEVDLIATNLPYFGCAFDGAAKAETQLYAAATYADYLEQMRQIIGAMKPALRRGGHVVAMVQNVQLGAQFVPQAWDIARLLAERFTLREERVLVYDRPCNTERAPAHANRAHEYVLVAQNEPQLIDLADSLACVQALAQQHGPCVVFGSFARWLRQGESAPRPADVDLMVAPDFDALARSCAWLEQQGFRLERWGAPMSAAALPAVGPSSHYVRARRLCADGRLCQLDLYFGHDRASFDVALAASECMAGLQLEARSATPLPAT